MKKKKTTMEHKFDDGDLVFKDDGDMGTGTIVRKRICYDVYWHDLKATTVTSEEHIFNLKEKKAFHKLRAAIEKERKNAIEALNRFTGSPSPRLSTCGQNKKIIYKVSTTGTNK